MYMVTLNDVRLRFHGRNVRDCCSIDDWDIRTFVVYNSRVITPACIYVPFHVLRIFSLSLRTSYIRGSVAIQIESLFALARLQ